MPTEGPPFSKDQIPNSEGVTPEPEPGSVPTPEPEIVSEPAPESAEALSKANANESVEAEKPASMADILEQAVKLQELIEGAQSANLDVVAEFKSLVSSYGVLRSTEEKIGVDDQADLLVVANAALSQLKGTQAARASVQLVRLKQLVDPEALEIFKQVTPAVGNSEKTEGKQSQEKSKEPTADEKISAKLGEIYQRVESLDPSKAKAASMDQFDTVARDLGLVKSEMDKLQASGGTLERKENHTSRIGAIRRQLETYRIQFINQELDRNLQEINKFKLLIAREKATPTLLKAPDARRKFKLEIASVIEYLSKIVVQVNQSFQIVGEGFGLNKTKIDKKIELAQAQAREVQFVLWSYSLPFENKHFDKHDQTGFLGFLQLVDAVDFNTVVFPVTVGGRQFSAEELVANISDLANEVKESVAKELITEKYTDYVNGILSLAEAQINNIKAAIERIKNEEQQRLDIEKARQEAEVLRLKKEQELALELNALKKFVDEQLNILGSIYKSGRFFVISINSDELKERYEPLIERVGGFKTKYETTDISDIETKILMHKFEAYGHTVLSMIDAATNIPKSSAVLSAERSGIYEARIYSAMSEIVERLEKELGRHTESSWCDHYLTDLKRRVDAFSMLLFSTNTSSASIVGDGKVRSAPNGLVVDNFPLDTDDYINNLIRGEYEGGVREKFDPGYNPVLETKTIHFANFFGNGEIPFEYQETAVSWCMNLIRKIFNGSVPDAINANNNRISTGNLHISEEDLVDYVYDKLCQHMLDLGLNDKIPMVSKTMVKRAYQLQLLLTGDHCALAKDSVQGMSDQIYYAFNLIRHIAKYASQGRTDADLLPILMLVTPDKSFSPIRDAYLHRRQLRVDNKLESLGANNISLSAQRELYETFGHDTTKFLLSSLFYAPNVAKGFQPVLDNDKIVVDASGATVLEPRVTQSFLVPPLRALPAEVNREAVNRGEISFDGLLEEKGPVQMVKRSDLDQLNPTITIDDLQDIETGEIPYSAIDWSTLSGQIRGYWDGLSKNGGWLIDLLMGGEDSFIKTIGDVSSLGGNNNKINYATQLLSKAAPETRVNRKLHHHRHPEWSCTWTDFATNGITARLILARVMLLAERTGPKSVAAKTEINEYLNDIAQQKIFPKLGEEATKLLLESIRIIANEGRGLRAAASRAGYKIQESLKQRFKVT